MIKDKKHHESEVVEDFEIYSADVADKIKGLEDLILLDVRTEEEYKGGHIKGALFLPVQELSQQSLAEIGLGESSKNKEIIIYCRSGVRSKMAYDIMNLLDFTNIKSLADGMIGWKEGGYKIINKQ